MANLMYDIWYGMMIQLSDPSLQYATLKSLAIKKNRPIVYKICTNVLCDN